MVSSARSREGENTMDVNLAQLVSWLSVGALAGYVIGLVLRRTKAEGTNHLANLGIGMVGALVGGFIFDVLGIATSLEAFRITLRDIVAALAGSLLFLGAIWIVKKQLDKKDKTTASSGESTL
jgi:uncharacterized membrane protein YeaQ/YmgE (transglycosylase-associated protein family)